MARGRDEDSSGGLVGGEVGCPAIRPCVRAIINFTSPTFHQSHPFAKSAKGWATRPGLFPQLFIHTLARPSEIENAAQPWSAQSAVMQVGLRIRPVKREILRYA